MHPSIRILALFALAAAVHAMQWRGLCGALVVLGIMLLYFRATLAGNIFYRARWLMVSLLLIYAYATPGEYLRDLPFELLPTYEGIAAGTQQVLRLALMLAALALLLATTGREQLMGGIYQLLLPLRWLGFPPERFAARLWLTLHYVEQTPLPRRQAIDQFFRNMHADADEVGRMEKITINLQPMGWKDATAVAVMLGVGWLLK